MSILSQVAIQYKYQKKEYVSMCVLVVATVGSTAIPPNNFALLAEMSQMCLVLVDHIIISALLQRFLKRKLTIIINSTYHLMFFLKIE
jgi:hypothetical protein